MERALKAAGRSVNLVRLPGEDHWLSRSETRIRMLEELETFLGRYLDVSAGTAESAAIDAVSHGYTRCEPVLGQPTQLADRNVTWATRRRVSEGAHRRSRHAEGHAASGRGRGRRTGRCRSDFLSG
jgi:hypothetical protein